MKTKVLAILSFITLLSCQSNAQNSDASGVKTALEAYLHAGDINDVEKLKPYLHADFRVVLYDDKKDATSTLSKDTYVSFIDTKKFGGYQRSVAYEDIQMIGAHMASVKVTLTSPGKPTLKNFYSLVKVKGKWTVIQDYVILIP